MKKKSWLQRELDDAEREVKRWPAWMRGHVQAPVRKQKKGRKESRG